MKPRLFRHVFVGLLIFTLSAVLFNVTAFFILDPGDYAEPIYLKFRLTNPEKPPFISASYFITGRKSPVTMEIPMESAPGRKITFGLPPAPVKSLYLNIHEGRIQELQQVTVLTGNKSFTYSNPEFLSRWENEKLSLPFVELADSGKILSFRAPLDVRFSKSPLPILKNIINWPGDREFLSYFFKSPKNYISSVLFIDILLLLLFLMLKRAGMNSLLPEYLGISKNETSDTAVALSWKRDAGTVLTGAGILVVGITILESIHGYYFTQDDNFVQFFPIILQACRSMTEGVLPVWTPCQIMGAPTLSLGVYSLTYPLTYISYFISRFIMGNEYLTNEVFCILHLILGYLAIYWMAGIHGISPKLSMSASLSVVLSGYFLIGGRSWYYMMPVMLWLPLMMVSLKKLSDGNHCWKWALKTGIIIGLFFHGGNIQMWAYSLIFFCFSVLLLMLSGRIRFSAVLSAVSAVLFGLAISAPLLIPQMLATAGADRFGDKGGGIPINSLPAFFLPYPVAKALHPGRIGNLNLKFMGQFYYSGTVFMLIGFMAMLILIGFLISRRGNDTKQAVWQNIWLINGALALILGLGRQGLLWSLMNLAPILSKFRLPFKFLPFITIFLVIGGGIVLQRVLNRLRNGSKITTVVAVLVPILLLYHVFLCRPSFYTYTEKPYPSLPLVLMNILKSGNPLEQARFFSIAPKRSIAPDYVMALQHNFPSVYGVYSMSGYEAILSSTPQIEKAVRFAGQYPLSAMRIYGVRWILIHRIAFNPVFSDVDKAYRDMEQVYPFEAQLFNAIKDKARLVLSLPSVGVFEMPDADPMACSTADGRPLPMKFGADGALVNIPADFSGGGVMVNILNWPQLRAYYNNGKIETEADPFGRVMVNLPAGAGVLKVRYEPPFAKGFMAGAILVLIATGILGSQTPLCLGLRS